MTNKKTKINKNRTVSQQSLKEICEYCHDKVDNLLESTPKFSFFYHLMTIFVYLGVMFIVWGFVYYAYSINIELYTLLCIKCSVFTKTIIKIIITFWIFALYFYFLCELRCRAWDMDLFVKDVSVRKTNKWILAISFLFAGLTSLFIWF